MIVDVWMQHPTLRFLSHDAFASLRRWVGDALPTDEPPIGATIGPELVRYLRDDGRKKVMFGTNWPMIAPQKALEDLDGLELDDEARELFLSDNARAAFRL